MATLAFWHPFGPHGGETPEEIIERKRIEIQNNEWTLWSFQHRKPETIQSWLAAIQQEKPDQVLVLCIATQNAQDPANKNEISSAKQFTENYGSKNQDDWNQIPNNIDVPHPSWTKKGLASAFKISEILLPPENRIDGWPRWKICNHQSSIVDNQFQPGGTFKPAPSSSRGLSRAVARDACGCRGRRQPYESGTHRQNRKTLQAL